MSTISLTLSLDITQFSKPSRTLLLEYPFGLTFGEPGDADGQREVLLAALEEGVQLTAHSKKLPFSWERDDLRVHQLRKEAR